LRNLPNRIARVTQCLPQGLLTTERSSATYATSHAPPFAVDHRLLEAIFFVAKFDGMLPAVDAKRMAREAKRAKQITLDQDSGNGGWVTAGSRFAPRVRQSLDYRLLPEPEQCSKFPTDSTVL
jgi:hypothetical protein